MQVFGSLDKKHPGVEYLFNTAGPIYLGGEVVAVSPIMHYDFMQYRHTPSELKQLFKLYGWSNIIGFQTSNTIHCAHFELMQRAAADLKGIFLIHPVVGMTRKGDVDVITRVQCYEAILPKFPGKNVVLSLLPLAMRMGGPREALWHALIRKNYGVTHFIVGRDHAGPGLDQTGRLFYDPYAAQTLANQYKDEIGIEILAFSAMVYVKEKAKFYALEEVSPTERIEDISGTELRKYLEQGLPIPKWFTFPAVIKVLQKSYPPKHKQGFTVFFTGLSGAGKSTIAKALSAFLESTFAPRKISLLDDDVIRRQLSGGLGFSKTDRDIQIQRIGFVASEITKHGGIAICAAIAPYAEAREQIKNNISELGGFFEVYVSTPLSVCKERDLKGLYRKAEMGLIQQFTGISDPYEIPNNPDISLDASMMSVYDAVQKIYSLLLARGYLLHEMEHSFTIKNPLQESEM